MRLGAVLLLLLVGLGIIVVEVPVLGLEVLVLVLGRVSGRVVGYWEGERVHMAVLVVERRIDCID